MSESHVKIIYSYHRLQRVRLSSISRTITLICFHIRLPTQLLTSATPVTSTIMLWSRWRLSTRMWGDCLSYQIAILKYCSTCRLILDTAGLGWVAPSHQNDRGSHSTRKTDIPAIFGNSSKEVIRGIIQRYHMDFKICGYEETLQQLLLLVGDTA